jgi:predicted butyrate kinase (DUF1464 family)
VAPIDVVAGPSGYGLPLTAARDLTERDLRLLFLAAEGEPGGIGGLRSLVRALGRLSMPVVLTPGVVHLPSVPAHRKVNRVDMGTADKVCAAALAVHDQAVRRGCSERDTSFIMLEIGGAFTAAVAIDSGQIVDGIGGTSGPLGVRACGALDGEVAYLAGRVTKQMLFQGGAATIAGDPRATVEMLMSGGWGNASEVPSGSSGTERASLTSAVGAGFSRTERPLIAWSAHVESAVKAVAALSVVVPNANEIILSGRGALVEGVREEFVRRFSRVMPRAQVRVLAGFASVAKQAAQGAALIADGLAGGRSARLVEALGIRAAAGTALDHLYVIDPLAARVRLGID